MKFTDALLLEEYRETNAVWLANRGPNGPRGSGSQADPWNATTIPYPEVPVTSITRIGLQAATVITAISHGFAEGDWITIRGVDIALANNLDVYFTGTFQIYSVRATSFSYTFNSDATQGSTTNSSTAPGTAIVCLREREQFDAIMRAMPEDTRVNLGPGLYDTKGMSFSVISWQPKSGQTIVGAGMAQTTLRLVGVAVAETGYLAVCVHYYNFLHDFTISDLTIDCNVEGQLTDYVTCGAVVASGRHNRIRRVRAINWASRTASYVENFVFITGATHPSLTQVGKEGVDCVVEDCIAERPSPNPRNNTSVIVLAGGEEPTDGYTSYHRGCAIRNCVVDGRIIYGSSMRIAIESITTDGTTVTVKTKRPHLLTVPGNVLISGVSVNGGNANNLFNGVFAVDSLDGSEPDTKFTYKLTSIDMPDQQNGFVGGGIPTQWVAIKTIEAVGAPGTNQFKITTQAPHYRTQNNNLKVSGLFDTVSLVTSSAYNGSFDLALTANAYDPSKPTEIIYTLLTNPDFPVDQLDTGTAFVGVGHICMSGDAGTGAVLEGNRIFHAQSGGSYHDSWASIDLIVRGNYYHDIVIGPFQNFGSISTGDVPTALVSLNPDPGDNTVAVATTSSPHGFRKSDRVTIAEASLAIYNGTFVISDVPSATEFKYIPGVLTGPATGAGYFTFEAGPPPVTAQHRLVSLYRVQRGSRFFASAKIATELPYGTFKHGLLIGDAVRVTFAGHFDASSYPNSTIFNGPFRVTAVPDAQTFEYELPSDPGTDSSDAQFAPGYFGRIWQVRRLVIEKNVMELNVQALTTDYGHHVGVAMFGTILFPPEPSLREMIIRGNVIRHVDDASAPSTRAIECGGCEQVLIDNNIISMDRATPIESNPNSPSYSFNNVRPDGTILRVFDGTAYSAPDVTTQIQNDLDDVIIVNSARKKRKV